MKDRLIGLYKNHRETIENLFWRALQTFGKQGVTFVIFLLCARFLTPHDFGIYNYVLAIVFLLIMFSDFGIATATSKYVAEYNVADKEKLRVVIFNSAIIILSLTIIGVFLVIFFGPWYLKEKYNYVLCLLPLIFTAPMTSLYDGVYRGLKKFKQLSVISLCVGSISLVAIYFLVRRYGIYGALASQNLFDLVLLLSLAIGHKELHLRLNKSVIKEVGSYSLFYGLAVIGNYLFIRFGILILGKFNYLEQIATYELINKFFLIALMPFTLLGQVIAPNFAVFSRNQEYSKIKEKFLRFSVLFFIIGLLLGALFYFLLPILFQIFFPQYFGKAYFGTTFILCLIVYVFNVWAATIDFGIIVPSGYAPLMAKLYLALGVFGVILDFVFIYTLGYIGVFLSFVINSFFMFVLSRAIYLLAFKKRGKVLPTV